MIAQPLAFSASVEVAESYRKMVRAVDDAVQALSLEVAAGATDIAKPDLRAMIDGRNGRRLPTDVAAIIARRIGPGAYQDAILAAVREMFGAVDIKPEADGPYIDRLQDGYAEFDEMGRSALARHRKAARRE